MGEVELRRSWDYPEMMTTLEVAQLFGVTTRTVIRWLDGGLFTAIKTPGGHLRFYAEEVREAWKLGFRKREM